MQRMETKLTKVCKVSSELIHTLIFVATPRVNVFRIWFGNVKILSFVVLIFISILKIV